MSYLDDVLRKVVQLMGITDKGLGADYPAAASQAGFWCFFEKITVLTLFGSHFARFRAI